MAYHMKDERRAQLMRLSAEMGVSFNDFALLDEALTHPSYTNEAKETIPHNERLEFLGDAVLELASSTYLYARFPDCSEGELTKMRASLVQSDTLARLARALDLGSCLRLGRGEFHNGGADRQNNLENAFEAVIGAVYLDAGWETAKEYVARQLSREADHIKKAQVVHDYKTTLQEHIQQRRNKGIVYELIDESGPDHDKRFTMRVLVDNQPIGEGAGRSKKEAEQQAAAAALAYLGYS